MDSSPRSTQSEMNSTTETRTLFDTMSTDVLSLIVKEINTDLAVRMRERLRDTYYWGKPPEKSIIISFLTLLFSENSPFRAASSTLFSSMEVHLDHSRYGTQDNGRELNIGEEVLEGKSKEIELDSMIFSACGPYVRKIRLSGCSIGEDGHDFLEQIKSLIFQNCRNVAEISFDLHSVPLTSWGTACSFLQEYAANLRVIEWNGDKQEEGFADLQECTNLKQLKAERMNTATLISLLKASGSTLEELDIYMNPVFDITEIMATIRDYCKQLTVISMENLKDIIVVVGEDSYSSLLCSYGSQLKKANVDGLGYVYLAEVAKACTNLEVTVKWRFLYDVDWQKAEAISPRVVSFVINSGVLFVDECPRALKGCSEIRELRMVSVYRFDELGNNDEIIANVFTPSCFPKLERLSIEDFNASKNNMALIASCTSNLKAAYFRPFEDYIEVSAFQFIVDFNKHLTDIRISESSFLEKERSTRLVLETLSELVKIFSKCQSLWFEIFGPDKFKVKRENVDEICKVLPSRGVNIHVGVGNIKYDVNGIEGCTWSSTIDSE